MSRHQHTGERPSSAIGSFFISARYARVLVGQSVSVMGTNATALVVPLIAVILLNCSSFQMGVLSAAQSMAPIVIGLYIGRVCDRIGADRTMLLSNCIGLAATGLLFALVATTTLSFPVLVAVMVVLGAVSLIFDVSRTGYLLQLVPESRLPHGNALMEGGSAIGEGLGPTIGGWLFHSVNAAAALLLDALTYALSSILVFWNIHTGRKETIPETKETTDDTERKTPLRDDLRGFSFILRNHVLRSIAFSAAQFNCFTAAFYAIYYVYVVRDLGLNAMQVGLASTASGVAGVLAGGIAGKIVGAMSPGPLYALSLIIPAFSALLVPLSSPCPTMAIAILVAASQFIWSFTITMNLVVSESVKQTVSPKEIIGRVSAAERIIALISEPVGSLLGGLSAQLIGSRTSIIGCAIGMLLSACWTLDKQGIRSFQKPSSW